MVIGQKTEIIPVFICKRGDNSLKICEFKLCSYLFVSIMIITKIDMYIYEQVRVIDEQFGLSSMRKQLNSNGK